MLGAITIGRSGEQLAPMAEMAELGVNVFTDDGTGVQDDRLMRRALEYASGLGVTLAQHCEVTSLSEGTCMHEGLWSSRLGLPGQPSEAEELMVMRDIALARMTGARIHFQHLSTAGSVAMVEGQERRAGRDLGGGPAPLHAHRRSAARATARSSRSTHRCARTPTSRRCKRSPEPGSSTRSPLTTHLTHRRPRSCPSTRHRRGMRASSTRWRWRSPSWSTAGTSPRSTCWPRCRGVPRIGGFAGHGRPVAEGEQANLVVIDPGLRWRIDGSGGASRSRNVPCADARSGEQVRHTIVGGEPVVVDGEALR
ncbi:MAG: hypothetical protein R2716_03705 [Microthrixaceae bacterium]